MVDTVSYGDVDNIVDKIVVVTETINNDNKITD